MNEERTQLDYLRRWRVIIPLNHRFQYPFSKESRAIFDEKYAKTAKRDAIKVRRRLHVSVSVCASMEAAANDAMT